LPAQLVESTLADPILAGSARTDELAACSRFRPAFFLQHSPAAPAQRWIVQSPHRAGRHQRFADKVVHAGGKATCLSSRPELAVIAIIGMPAIAGLLRICQSLQARPSPAFEHPSGCSQNAVEQPARCLLSIAGDAYIGANLPQHFQRHLLIEQIVFNQQDGGLLEQCQIDCGRRVSSPACRLWPA